MTKPLHLALIVAAMTAGGGLLGALLGWALGRFAPGYYRTVFPGAARDPLFDPVEVGVGLGVTQGAVLGFVGSLVVVLGVLWFQRRSERKYQAAFPVLPAAYSTDPPGAAPPHGPAAR